MATGSSFRSKSSLLLILLILTNIFLVNIDGSNRQILLGDPADDRQPSWSPDGSRILFSRSVSDFYHNLFTVRPDGTDLHALANNPGDTDLSATWSPAGDKIAFELFDWANFENIAIADAQAALKNAAAQGARDKRRELILASRAMRVLSRSAKHRSANG
jgi:dipeptidyl aminopeptidase/acylaminoacyl peptidase